MALYDIAKDLVRILKYKEKKKIVDRDYLRLSGIQYKYEQKGYTLRWTSPKNIESRRHQGYEIIYLVHDTKRIKTRLVRKDGSVLMGKKND